MGHALSCIRAVDDMRGLTARANRFVGAGTHPPKVKELKHVEAALGKWEEHGKVFKKDIGEVFSETVRVGTSTAMMPESIQEFLHSMFGDCC